MKELDFKIEKIDGYTLTLRSLKGKEPYVGQHIRIPEEKLAHPILILGGWIVVAWEGVGKDRFRVILRPRREDDLRIVEMIDEEVFRDLYEAAGLPVPPRARRSDWKSG